MTLHRRDFIAAAAAALPAAAAAQEFGPCPRTTEDFLRYIVERRAAEAVNRIIVDPKHPRYGTVYGGFPEDANIAWIAAAAYRYPWSRFHRHSLLRDRAFVLLDAIARIRASGKWDDGGLDAYFGPHSFGYAVLSWIETGDVDAPHAAGWREAVRKAADDGLICLHYGPYRPSAYTGQYANPELYFVAALAAAWKLTGEERYREEAARALRRYDEWLFPGGGMAYFLGSAPQHGYQQMIVKSVALYWDLTGDPYAAGFLRRLAPYFPNVQHRSGLMTDAEQSHLKHAFFNTLNPAVPAMLACALGDGANRHVADVAAKLMADSVDERAPSFGRKDYPWYNYHAATFAASALRLLERHPLPAPEPPPARRVFVDASFRGVRSHWDNFTAASGTRQMNDSLAGAYLADPREPLWPLNAAVDGVYFEVREGKTEFRCVEWSPTVTFAKTEGFASMGCLTRLCARYWGDMPYIAGEPAPNQVSAWTSIQQWAVWRDSLIGLGSLRCGAPGGAPNSTDAARVRWRLAPQGRKFETLEQSETILRFRYGGLQIDLLRLDQKGGFAFASSETPLLVRPAPWASGEFLHVATVIRPSTAEGSVHIRALRNGAAAVLLEPGARKAYVWAVNLHRQLQQYLLDLPPAVQVRTFKRDVEMPAVPAGEPANAGLIGGESAIWVLESKSPLDASALLAGLRAGKSR